MNLVVSREYGLFSLQRRIQKDNFQHIRRYLINQRNLWHISPHIEEIYCSLESSLNLRKLVPEQMLKRKAFSLERLFYSIWKSSLSWRKEIKILQTETRDPIYHFKEYQYRLERHWTKRCTNSIIKYERIAIIFRWYFFYLHWF